MPAGESTWSSAETSAHVESAQMCNPSWYKTKLDRRWQPCVMMTPTSAEGAASPFEAWTSPNVVKADEECVSIILRRGQGHFQEKDFIASCQFNKEKGKIKKKRRRINLTADDEGDASRQCRSKCPFLLKQVPSLGILDKIYGIPRAESSDQVPNRRFGSVMIRAESEEAGGCVVQGADLATGGDGQEKDFPCHKGNNQCPVGTLIV